ncbi:MAG: hypothetical protein JXB46_09270, partial [Candidatus Eisenbacteria bacterium]|nr:hypothetical protein [Candidatus Eisenbacteria bacterium]
WLSEALLYAGSRKQATVQAERASTLAGHLAVTRAFVASAYYLEGRRCEGDRVLGELENQSRRAYVSPALLARVHIARGSIEDAVGCAELAFRNHDHWLQGITAFAPELRFSEPRLAAVLERMGLPTCVPATRPEFVPGPSAREAGSKTPESGPSPARVSIAVMPFADMSPERDQEYFCDGVSEEIINALTGLSGLRVIARTSAFSFKGKNEDIREIGRKLDVTSILEGSVRKAGDRVRVTAQLIDVADGSHIWSERYDRVLEDVFAIQDDIAAAIVQRLRLDLSDTEKDKIAEERRVDPEAHDLYLRGRHLFTRGFFTVIAEDQTRVKKAIEFYQKAAEVDPGYADPHASLAGVYAALCRWVEPKGNCERARLEGTRALELDDSSEVAHIAMADVVLSADLDWNRARSECMRALELNPGSANAQKCCAAFFTWAAEFARAIGHAKKALALDPLDYNTHLLVTFATMLSRRDYEESIELSEAALELFPGDKYFESHILWGRAMLGIDVEEIAEVYGNRWPTDAVAGVLYAIAGRREDARRVIELRDTRGHQGARYDKARVYAALGEKDEALRLLEETWEHEPRALLQLNSDPELDCLRGEQRFKDLVRRSGVPTGELAYLSE